MRMRSIYLLLITLLFMGCATSYHPINNRGYGFSEKRLSEQSFLVSFSGNARTSSTEVQHMLLRRCAEITVQNGFNYFIIVDKESDKKSSLSHSTFIDEYDTEEEYTKAVQIYMALEKEVSPEGLQKAVNAGIYLMGN